ncbi:MAG: flagellar hook associated protein [Lachnospiraceae bacterium]|jgi:flagellin|nr:flagellar hook associated protein [Lachnospiraceae bacterium]
MIIQHNIAAINSYRNLGVNQSGLNKNLEKLSSGYKINRAGDDAAGLAISESMRSQINGLNQAVNNANDAIGLIQTAEGALTEVHSMLQRMTTLATQAANGTYNSVARGNLQSEVDELLNEIDRIANYTDFNGIKPLADITKGNAGVMTFQIGPTSGETIKVTGQPMTVFGIDAAIRGIKLTAGMEKELTNYINTGAGKDYFYIDKETGAVRLQNKAPDKGSITGADNKTHAAGKGEWSSESVKGTVHAYNAYKGLADALKGKYSGIVDATKGVTGTYTTLLGMNVGLTTTNKSNQAIDTINAAINAVSSYRAKLGAAQNRLEHTINNLEVTSENITSAESRIRDTDMADEITAFTKNNILLQASQSMLAQSNSVPQNILSLLS